MKQKRTPVDTVHWVAAHWAVGHWVAVHWVAVHWVAVRWVVGHWVVGQWVFVEGKPAASLASSPGRGATAAFASAA